MSNVSVPRLLPPPAPPAEPALSPDQERVLARIAAGGHGVVVGPPGCGRTTVAVHALARALQGGADPDRVVLLAPTRVTADALRNRVASLAKVAIGAPVVASPQALAFRVLRLNAAAAAQPAPTMITGAEQDGILADLLAGHRAGGGVQVRWPASIPLEATGLRAFRDELRDVFMRAAEGGLDPEDLMELATTWGRPEWQMAAQLYGEYRGVTSLPNAADDPARFDPAVALDEACATLAAWDPQLPVERPRWQLVLVDDFQDATVGTMRFVRQLAADGAQIVAFAEPDLGVQGYRGGEPALAAQVQAPAPQGLGAWSEQLTTGWRAGGAITAAVGRVARHIRGPGAQWRTCEPAAGLPDGQVDVLVCPSPSAQAAWLADIMRRAHLLDHLPYSEMAVVTRSAGHVREIADALRLAGVPVDVPATEVALRDEVAIRPFLDLIRVAGGALELSAELCADLLSSPIGGQDAVATRRLRRALLASREARSDPSEHTDPPGPARDVLVEALEDAEVSAGIEKNTVRGLMRVRGVLDAARAGLERADVGPGEVLWDMWQASGLAEPWRAAALAGGPGAARADRNLDVMLALFKAAERFTERMPGAGPLRFVQGLEREDLPSDTLSARAWRAGAVSVVTATSAVGRQWSLVAITGLQEDTWPDLRLRDTVLSARLITDICLDRAVAGAAAPEERRRAILDDELRMLTLAMSRAKERLILLAVSDADTRPSAFVDIAGVEPVHAGAPPLPFDLRGLVAGARHTVLSAAASAAGTGAAPPDAAPAAALLRYLTLQGVAGASPEQWAGLAGPTTWQALHEGAAPVTLSPSRVETLTTCPLRWLLETSGGRAAASAAQNWGTFIHHIAHLMGEGLAWKDEFERGVGAIAPPDTWQGRRDQDRLRAMVAKLEAYHAAHPDVLGTELAVSASIEGVSVRGRVDRVERTARGVRIVDFKTGVSAPSVAAAATNAQLGVYQAAVEAGELRSDDGAEGDRTWRVQADGAALVYLGTSTRGATERSQPPLADSENPGWARELLSQSRQLVSSADFEARVGAHCASCAVAGACPAQARGEQVTT